MPNSPIEVRTAAPNHAGWIAETLRALWRSTQIVSRGVAHDATALPALLAWRESEPVGLATYLIGADECELISLNALRPHAGVGTALLNAVAQVARSRGCQRLVLVTTNDNLDALRFYQRRGLRLVALHANAVAAARALKPEIPQVGCFGIPVRDELELELPVDGG